VTRVLHVVGTRPNFMKVAPIIKAVERWNEAHGVGEANCISQKLVHTGQHYDAEMSSIFFEQLGLPEPDVYLGVGSGSHAQQTAGLMMALEPVVRAERPDLVVVVGDVNTTVAAALVAVKEQVPVAHVEAGLRSGDRGMPEEINRLVTDRVSSLLFTTSAAADRQLRLEGVDPRWIHFVGNTMIDCLEASRELARSPGGFAELSLDAGGYGLVTLHRPSNVDDPARLGSLVTLLTGVAEQIPVVFPIHVRTAQRLTEAGLLSRLERHPDVHLLPPASYFDFLGLLRDARLVLTDSGGIQAEACVMGTPCLTLRTTTEWVETVQAGVNRLVDPGDVDQALTCVQDELRRPLQRSAVRPELWDGHAAERIVAVIAQWAAEQGGAS